MDDPVSRRRSSRADRYLSVRLEPVVAKRRWTRFRHRVVPFLVALTSVWGRDEIQAIEPTRVVVTRRSDGAPLVTYDYQYRLSAVGHRDSLRGRFATEHIFDMCRHPGIDIAEVGSPSNG